MDLSAKKISSSIRQKGAPMTIRSLASRIAFAAVIVASMLTQTSASRAQSPATKATPAKTASAAKAWTPPLLPDGEPDLQGVWTNNTVTDLERPKALAGKEF